MRALRTATPAPRRAAASGSSTPTSSKRSLECLFDTDGVDGFCFFSYQYLYDPLTGKANEALAEEYAGFAPLIRNK